MGMAKGLLERGLMDALGYRKLVGKAMVTHLIGGIVSVGFANYIFKFLF